LNWSIYIMPKTYPKSFTVFTCYRE
jgi:hypothetical protein